MFFRPSPPVVPARVLFLLKHRDNYHEFPADYSYGQEQAGGLLHSARFVADMLRAGGVPCELVQVTDNNDIDREVSRFDPTHVIIEALWVVPEKFDVLQRLHPSVQWVVRGHSEIPFLASEGVAVDWILRYVLHPRVSFATNSESSLHDLRSIVQRVHPEWSERKVEEKVVYLPNYYPVDGFGEAILPFENEWHIACLGAIRPLKNNLMQAVAAIEFADRTSKQLYFYVNGTRREQGGENALKNLRALFAHHPRHILIEQPWMSHHELMEMLECMDVSMNVSFTETFNITAADSVAAGCALVTSPQVDWSSRLCQADPTSRDSIVSALYRVTHPVLSKWLKRRNQARLREFTEQAKFYWFAYLFWGV